jgi:hypothetical protein
MTALALDSTGNLATPMRLVRGVESCRVQVYLRMALLAGTYPTDVTRGVPWEAWTGADGTKGPTALQARALIRRQLEQVPCVTAILSLAVTRANFRLSVVGTLAVEDDGEAGTLELGTLSDPFPTSGPPPWYVVTRGLQRIPRNVAARRR